MKRLSTLFSILSLCAILFYGPSLLRAQSAANAIAHGAFPVKVTKTLDSSKLKDGDAFEVETAGSFKLADGTLVPKGSKIIGHVVASKARSKGDPNSQLTLAFDRLSISGGKQMSLKGEVQAVFPPAEEPMAPNMASAGTSQGGSARGSTVGGGVSSPAGVSSGGVGVTDSKTGSDTQSSSSAQPVMDPKASGVQGMHDLSLADGVLTSKGKNVKLGGGVRIIVTAEILGYSSQS